MSRDEWIEVLQELFAGSEHTAEVTDDVDRAFELLEDPVILALTVDREADCIERLSVARDRLLDRRRPVIMLLQRDGPGMRRLAQESALASFVQGSPEVDLDEEVDIEAERTDFHRLVGSTPEDWLSRYRSGEIADTLDSALLYLRAHFLVGNAL